MQEISILQKKDIIHEENGITFIYGSGSAYSTTAWDYNTMYACVCDSSWEVGFGPGQIQLSEYFGPDCSQSKLLHTRY